MSQVYSYRETMLQKATSVSMLQGIWRILNIVETDSSFAKLI